MPDPHGCFTTNEIHHINDCKERILKEYDNGVRKYGSDIARNGLRKALEEVLRQEHRESCGAAVLGGEMIDLTRHWNLGRRITLYGRNAMSWAVNIHTKRWGFICFNIPFLSKWRFHFYLSPNATPWASTYYFGHDEFGRGKEERLRARIRKFNFGHGFKWEQKYDALSALNNKFDSLTIRQFDIERYGDRSEED